MQPDWVSGAVNVTPPGSAGRVGKTARFHPDAACGGLEAGGRPRVSNRILSVWGLRAKGAGIDPNSFFSYSYIFTHDNHHHHRRHHQQSASDVSIQPDEWQTEALSQSQYYKSVARVIVNREQNRGHGASKTQTGTCARFQPPSS